MSTFKTFLNYELFFAANGSVHHMCVCVPVCVCVCVCAYSERNFWKRGFNTSVYMSAITTPMFQIFSTTRVFTDLVCWLSREQMPCVVSTSQQKLRKEYPFRYADVVVLCIGIDAVSLQKINKINNFCLPYPAFHKSDISNILLLMKRPGISWSYDDCIQILCLNEYFAPRNIFVT